MSLKQQLLLPEASALKQRLLLPEASDLWLSPAHKARQAAARVLAQQPGSGYIGPLFTLGWLRRQPGVDVRAVDDLAAAMAERLAARCELSAEVVKQLLLDCSAPREPR